MFDSTYTIRSVLLGLVVVLIPGIALAHDQWADNTEVPPWVKSSCCGPNDVHHLKPEQVTPVKNGYKVDIYPDVVPYSQVLPSPDGEYWIFFNITDTSSGAHYSPVYCFFVPTGA